MNEPLMTPDDLRSFLQVKSERTFSRAKKSFPRVPNIPMERYDPKVVRQVVQGDGPASRTKAVRAMRRGK